MKYKEIAYCNLSDSSSLSRLQDDEGNEVYAVGYQGDDVLHIIDESTAEELEDQAGGAWEEYEDYERNIIEAE